MTCSDLQTHDKNRLRSFDLGDGLQMIKKPLLLPTGLEYSALFLSNGPFSSYTESQNIEKGTSLLAYLTVDLLRTCDIKTSLEQAAKPTHASIDLAPGSLAKGMFSFFAGQCISIQCRRI